MSKNHFVHFVYKYFLLNNENTSPKKNERIKQKTKKNCEKKTNVQSYQTQRL